MGMAKLLAERSTCNRGQVGALLVKDNRVVSTGYVGAPSGEPHCLEAGCELGLDGGCIRTVHAEANTLAYAAKEGISTNGTHLYVTLSPCINCAKLLINAGVKKVFYLKKYRDTSGIDLLNNRGIATVQVEW